MVPILCPPMSFSWWSLGRAWNPWTVVSIDPSIVGNLIIVCIPYPHVHLSGTCGKPMPKKIGEGRESGLAGNEHSYCERKTKGANPCLAKKVERVGRVDWQAINTPIIRERQKVS